jgi:hypothetical protein
VGADREELDHRIAITLEKNQAEIKTSADRAKTGQLAAERVVIATALDIDRFCLSVSAD